jgi:hypothetical protein
LQRGGVVTTEALLKTYKEIGKKDGYLPKITRAENGNICLDACFIRGQQNRYTETEVIEIGVPHV